MPCFIVQQPICSDFFSFSFFSFSGKVLFCFVLFFFFLVNGPKHLPLQLFGKKISKEVTPTAILLTMAEPCLTLILNYYYYFFYLLFSVKDTDNPRRLFRASSAPIPTPPSLSFFLLKFEASHASSFQGQEKEKRW
jgi:hypothetical protein